MDKEDKVDIVLYQEYKDIDLQEQNLEDKLDFEYKFVVTKGEMWEGGKNWELESSSNTHTTIYKIINKDLLYSTGSYAQYSVTT